MMYAINCCGLTCCHCIYITQKQYDSIVYMQCKFPRYLILLWTLNSIIHHLEQKRNFSVFYRFITNYYVLCLTYYRYSILEMCKFTIISLILLEIYNNNIHSYDSIYTTANGVNVVTSNTEMSLGYIYVYRIVPGINRNVPG